MTTLDPNRKQLMEKLQELVRGLRDQEVHFNSHPLASEECINALIEHINIPVPPDLEPRGGGGTALLKALALLVLDSLAGYLSQSSRNDPLAYYEETERYGKLSPTEQMVIGLILVWFKDLLPGIKHDNIFEKSMGLRKVVGACRSPLAHSKLLKRIYRDANTYGRHLAWIPDCFAVMHELSDGGEGRASLYRRMAFDFIVHRLERVAAGLELRLEDLLLEPGGDEDSGQESLAETAEADLSLEPVSDWNAKLAQCMTDYHNFELAQFDEWREKQGLPRSLSWYQFRVARRPAGQPEQDAPRINLVTICKPEQRVALLDHRGSGTTAALLWLSNLCCKNAAKEPAVLRLDAEAYIRSRAGRPPSAFLASKVYGSGPESRVQREEFETTINMATTVWLIDNLARLSPDDQKLVMRDLRFSGLIFTATPGASDEFLTAIASGDVERFELFPLLDVQIEYFIRQFASRYGAAFDADLARHIALRELPETSRLPLGLQAICEQVLAQRGDCASCIEHFIARLLEHDGKPLPQWDTQPPVIPPGLISLMSLAWRLYKPNRETRIEFDEAYLPNYSRFRDHWHEGKTLPLLVSTGAGTYRFLNEEVFGFLAAAEEVVTGYAEKCNERTIASACQTDVVGITNRHYLALLKRIQTKRKFWFAENDLDWRTTSRLAAESARGLR